MQFISRYKWIIFTLCIWAIILCVPALRYHLEVATKGSPWIRSTFLPVHYGDNYSFSQLENPPLPIKVYQLQNIYQSIAFTTTKSALPPLDKLIEENPDLTWLIAARLHATIGAYNGNRQGGEFSDARSYEEIQKGKPSIEKNDTKVNFTPQELRKTLALCRQGEKLEPQNAYFTWMRVYFLMLNWQDKEAMKALNEADAKSYWNDHSSEYRQLYANATEKVLARPLTSFEKMMIAAMIPNDGGINARIREMGRILGWQGVKLKRAGKNEEALVLWANFYHVMSLAMQGDDNSGSFLVNYATASIAAVGPSYHGKNQKDKALIKKFIAYANKYHRPDLAHQIESDWQVNHGLFQQLRTYLKRNDYSRPLLIKVETAVLFLQCAVLIILSIAGALLGWALLNVHRALRRNKSTFGEATINVWDQCKGIFACSGVSSVLLGIVFLTPLIFAADALGWFGISAGWGTPSYFFLSSGDHYFDNIIDYLGNVSDLSSFSTYWRLIVCITPLICGALFALFHSRGEQQKSTFRQKISRNIYLALLFLAWGIIALTSQYGLTQTILAATCGIFLLLSFLRMWCQTKENTGHTIAIFRTSLAGWICTGSVLVLLLLIGQSAINHQMQPWTNNQLRGEMHLLHQVKNSAP